MKTYKLRRKVKPGRLLRDIPRGESVKVGGYEYTVLRNACSGETIIVNNDCHFIHCEPTDREDGTCEDALDFSYNVPNGLYEFEGGGVCNKYGTAMYCLNNKPATGKCWPLEILEE